MSKCCQKKNKKEVLLSKCKGKCRTGKRCKNKGYDKYCHLHKKQKGGAYTIPEIVLDKIDLFAWDFDKTITKLKTAIADPSLGKFKSGQKLSPKKNFSDPKFFVELVEALVENGKDVGIITHNSYVYYCEECGNFDDYLAAPGVIMYYLDYAFNKYGTKCAAEYFDITKNIIFKNQPDAPDKNEHLDKLIDNLDLDLDEIESMPNGEDYKRIVVFDDSGPNRLSLYQNNIRVQRPPYGDIEPFSRETWDEFIEQLEMEDIEPDDEYDYDSEGEYDDYQED